VKASYGQAIDQSIYVSKGKCFEGNEVLASTPYLKRLSTTVRPADERRRIADVAIRPAHHDGAKKTSLVEALWTRCSVHGEETCLGRAANIVARLSDQEYRTIRH